jgi:hypothetical protein
VRAIDVVGLPWEDGRILRATPNDWNRSHQHRINRLFGHVPWIRTVLESKSEKGALQQPLLVIDLR